MISRVFGSTAILLIFFSVSVSYIFQSHYPDESPCSDTPQLITSYHAHDGKSTTWNACDIFSLQYEEARQKFRTYSQNWESHSIPIVSKDEDLTIDITILRGDKPGVIIHSSAQHGVEGYAGSAIQLAYLQSLQDTEDSPAERPTIVLVHAINPYGMKHYRRVNENNVDLNRNAINNFDAFIKERDPNIAGYEDFKEFLSPVNSDRSYWEMQTKWFVNAVYLLYREGFMKLKTTMVAGQYHDPYGFSYGGKQLEPSLKYLFNFVHDRFSHEENIVWIDVHTGLGRFGKDTLVFEKEKSVDYFNKWFCKSCEHIVSQEVSNKEAMGGYELTRGTLHSYFQKLYKDRTTILQEFGTLPSILVARSLILEQEIHFSSSSDDDEIMKKIGRKLMQQSFYPQSQEWRKSIVQRGISLLHQAIEFVDHHNKPSSQ